MTKYLLCGVLAVALSGPAVAEKPEWAGEGKPTVEQKAAHKEAMKAKYDSETDDAVKIKKDKKIKKEKSPYTDSDGAAEMKGLEKQKLKKMEQERKELGKGSQTGQDGREESRKWWKFWE